MPPWKYTYMAKSHTNSINWLSGRIESQICSARSAWLAPTKIMVQCNEVKIRSLQQCLIAVKQSCNGSLALSMTCYNSLSVQTQSVFFLLRLKLTHGCWFARKYKEVPHLSLLLIVLSLAFSWLLSLLKKSINGYIQTEQVTLKWLDKQLVECNLEMDLI